MRRLLVPAFLIVQAVLVRRAANWERPALPPNLDLSADGLADWRPIAEDPLDPAVAQQLRADRLLSRTYRHRLTQAQSSLFVAWFQSQRSGNTSPHSPKVCLPAAGWTPVLSTTLRLPTVYGPISVNEYIVTKGPLRAVMLYWYQTPRRVIASEWTLKFFILAGAVRNRSAPSSLVRVHVWSSAGQDERAAAIARDFAAAAYPILKQCLGRS